MKKKQKKKKKEEKKAPLIWSCGADCIVIIMKTCLSKYTENFTTKKWKFSEKKNPIFFVFLLKT